MSITGDVLAAPRVTRPTSAGVSISVRGAHEAVLTLTGDLGPGAARLVEVVLDGGVADGVRHVIVDLSTVPEVPRPVREALASASWVLGRRGGWLLVEGGADVGRVDGAGADGPASGGGGGIESRSSLLDAFRAYRETVGR